MTGKEFKHQLDKLREVILSGLAFYTVWSTLSLYDPADTKWSIDEQNQVLGRWRGFFTPAGLALQRMAFIELAKVFDDDSKTASLRTLLNEARREPSLVPHATSGDLAAISAKLRHGKATLAALKKLRNQRLAHADQNPDPVPPPTVKTIEGLAEDIKDAFNRLSAAHDRSIQGWGFPLETCEEHTKSILATLLMETKRRQKELDDNMVAIVLNHIDNMKLVLERPLTAEELDSVVRQFGLSGDRERRVREACSTGEGEVVHSA